MRHLAFPALMAFLLLFPVGHRDGLDAADIIDEVKGCVEFVDSGAYKILRLDLASGNTEELFRIEGYASIAGFDLSRDKRMRVIGLNDSKGARIELFKDGKLFKTLVDHRHVRFPAFSPDGKRVAYIRSTHLKDSPLDWYLHTVNIDGSSDRQVSARSLEQVRPSWFPDGRRIAVGSRDLAIYVIDLASGSERKIIDFGMAPTVSHDGTKIAYLSKETTDKTKRQLREHMKEKDVREYYARTSPEERANLERLLYYESIYIYEVATGKSTKLTKEMPLEEPVVWSPDDRYIVFNDDAIGRQIHIFDIATGKSYKMPDSQGYVMTWTEKIM